ncbi:MAG: hypothetical protein GX964_07755 [Syntrophomonadaceae bacterium]|nr:hypothetical protein [Syntrophomonadaceae bacterium]
MQECNQEKLIKTCTCTYEGCERKGKCCLCVAYHRKKNQLPGCFFPPEVERTFDRSYRRFVECRSGGTE